MISKDFEDFYNKSLTFLIPMLYPPVVQALRSSDERLRRAEEELGILYSSL
jgi:hypothetical protein